MRLPDLPRVLAATAKKKDCFESKPFGPGWRRFRDAEGRPYRVPDWQGLAYGLLEDG